MKRSTGKSKDPITNVPRKPVSEMEPEYGKTVGWMILFIGITICILLSLLVIKSY